MDSLSGRGQAEPVMVAESAQFTSGGVLNTFSALTHTIHRRQPGGVWGVIGQSQFGGNVDAGRDGLTFQQPGAASSPESSGVFYASATRQTGSSLFGQYQHCVGHQQAGGDQIVVPDQLSLGSLDAVGRDRLSGQSETYPREIECIGGLSEQEQADYPHRMVHSPGLSGANLGEVGHPRGRLVCDTPQLQDGQICLPLSTPGRMEGQRIQLQLGGSLRICVPSLGYPTGGPTEGGGRSGEDDSDRANLDGQGVVPTADAAVSGRSHSFADPTGFIDTTFVREASSELRDTKLTGVAVIRNSLIVQGFSAEVSGRISSNIRASSLEVYDSKWRLFTEYCASKKADPLKVGVPFVADFLNWLFVDKQRNVSTIKGYRAAIARVLRKASGLDISNNDMIKDLMSNFCIERPFCTRELPKWDLNVVLDSLMRPPYEPLVSSSLTHISRKTAFLLLLASGARRGELHSIEVSSIVKSQNDNVWSLKPNPRFMAKNFRPQSGKGHFDGFKITKLKSLVKEDQFNDALCPIRSLKWYIHKTAGGRKHIRQLFLTCNSKGVVKAIHKNTLSSWIKKVIMDAYQTSDKASASLLHRSAHEVRAVAASFAAFGNVGMEQILKQCRWASSSTFAKHYLRRVTGESQGFKSLLPLQVAGAVLRA